MPLTVVLKGDSHFNLLSEGVARNDELDDAYRAAVREASVRRADLFVDLGDLTDDGKTPPRTVGMLTANWAALLAAGVPGLILAGNHDRRNLPDAECSLDAFSAFPWPAPGLKFSLEAEVWRPPNRPDVEVLCLPYVPSRLLPPDYKSPQDYYDRVARAWLATSLARVEAREPGPRARGRSDAAGTTFQGLSAREPPVYRLVVAHLNLTGAKLAGDRVVRPIDVRVPDALLGKVPVFTGHLHAYQILRREEPVAVVVGSTNYTNFGEARDEKGFVVWEVP